MQVNSATAVSTSYYEKADCLLVTPQYIRFGEVKLGENLHKKIEVFNPLDHEIEVNAYSMNESFIIGSRNTVKIKPGGTANFVIIFAPITNTYMNSQIRFNSDSTCRGYITVSGKGKE